MSEKKISVIVPVHNTKDFIQECIDSILAQTYKNIEIICIDSSLDETTSIIQEYVNKDKRVILIEDENNSYGYKINMGIRSAGGEFIAIVDSDDYIDKNMLERLYQIMEEHKVDFVKSDYTSFYVKDGVNVNSQYEYNAADISYYGKVFSSYDRPEILYQNAVSIWTGLYNKDFLIKNEIFLNESKGASFQDAGFSVLSHIFADKIYYLMESYYYYRIDNANSSVKSQKKYKTIADESRWIDEQLKQRKLTNPSILLAVKIKKIISYSWNYRRLNNEEGNKFLDYIHDELLEEYIDSSLREKIPEYIKERFDELFLKEKPDQLDRRAVLRIDSVLKNNHVVLIGAGRLGKKILTYDIQKKINGVVMIYDNFVSQVMVEGRCFEVKKVDDIVVNPEHLYLIANKCNVLELEEQLNKLNITNRMVCSYFPVEKVFY
ncbi:putative glycosyltransferase EpsJ [Lachnospiraceae bacterium]|nr:putative glycosyltransferase EpsJ [Lachnospiraceae bacterium]